MHIPTSIYDICSCHIYIHIGTFRLLANLSNIFLLGVIQITIFTTDFPFFHDLPWIYHDVPTTTAIVLPVLTLGTSSCMASTATWSMLMGHTSARAQIVRHVERGKPQEISPATGKGRVEIAMEIATVPKANQLYIETYPGLSCYMIYMVQY